MSTLCGAKKAFLYSDESVNAWEAYQAAARQLLRPHDNQRSAALFACQFAMLEIFRPAMRQYATLPGDTA